MTHSFDALILGGGAAGLMCAVEAGKRGRRVAVLDHADRLGKKILISGGGRCNFTNIHCRPENFLSSNPHVAKSALACYTPEDFIALVEKHRIPYHEKTLGQLFCDRSAGDILAMLEEECREAGVTIFLSSRILKVERKEVERDTAQEEKREERPEGAPGETEKETKPKPTYILRTANAEFQAPALVVATGGLSIPKIGATKLGYELARQFGLAIRTPWPGLVPLVFDAEDHGRFCDLMGLSAEVVASCNNQQFREKMLITHRGLSGPAILQISSYWKKPQPIRIDLAPGREVTAAFRDPATPRHLGSLRTELRKSLPSRFADRWLDVYPPVAWTNQALADLERHLHAWPIVPAETEGYEKAEVTVGGVDTDELSAKTMESRKVPGLYFIGEVVDVTGHLGGFNFQWAWASGAAAGRAL